jgi:uncharacterized protein (TIGR00299 family) protein
VIAYFELIGGASGNMLLGALLDAGADLGALEAALNTIPVDGWRATRTRVVKRGIAATYFDFEIPGEDHAADSHEPGHAPPHAHGKAERRLADVLDIIERSGLSTRQKARAAAIYRRLGEAEALVHGGTVAGIHFHEVGQVDAILDVAGFCVALDLLGVERLYCSAFPVGRGSISMSHGRYPNPPPATAELLRGSPLLPVDVDGEMVTTTGAAILTSLVEHPGLRPAFAAERIGYGAGRSEFVVPNVVRASLGREVGGAGTSEAGVGAGTSEAGGGAGTDEVSVLEANVDDMQPQHFELALERVLAAGAFDAWLAPVTMKKSRPAVLFGAVAPLEREADVARALLENTTTLGVRVRHERRYVLERSVTEVVTELGPVRVKTAKVAGGVRRTLEYDDVARIARERGRPLAEIAARLEELLPPP